MLARMDMSPEDEAFARTQDKRVQWLHEMVMARGARTDEQNKYFKDVLDGLKCVDYMSQTSTSILTYLTTG
ncbi:hypothetical protein AA0112_g7273 [Alternaria arborescens]|uniref:hypothetical protein n=1 Tax=Alternaria arborescens TaxID=156630 RepID=UPI001075327C|nr:hypothetical protein AA0111_g2818 [Alternaria arborescens]RYN29199.1 hypothetical protein AA0112_g7273 [Alternaria arborescens]RYO36503.1 hypothetical protein AA0111_g2818 [Alternaria arborescens]